MEFFSNKLCESRKVLTSFYLLQEKESKVKKAFTPMKKKTTRGVMDGVPLTQEGVCQVNHADYARTYASIRPTVLYVYLSNSFTEVFLPKTKSITSLVKINIFLFLLRKYFLLTISCPPPPPPGKKLTILVANYFF